MTCKILEFVQDADGRNSSTRLCMVFGVFLGGIINCYMAYQETLTEGIFGIFMGAAAGIYSWGKYRESAEKVEQIRADSPNPPVITDANISADVTVNSTKRRKNAKSD